MRASSGSTCNKELILSPKQWQDFDEDNCREFETNLASAQIHKCAEFALGGKYTFECKTAVYPIDIFWLFERFDKRLNTTTFTAHYTYQENVTRERAINSMNITLKLQVIQQRNDNLVQLLFFRNGNVDVERRLMDVTAFRLQNFLKAEYGGY